MRRILAAALAGALLLLMSAPAADADAPLCALAPEFTRQSLQRNAAWSAMGVAGALGAAVYDLRSGTIWSGGQPGPYALHSIVKPPVAWAVLTDAHEQEHELTRFQRDAIYYMVAWSQNHDVEALLGLIGGLPGLNAYYERWGVPALAALQHDTRWGSGRAVPTDLARLYAALAQSPRVPEPVRREGFDLLRAVVDAHRWGAALPESRLLGWEALLKTGNYTLPDDVEESDDDSDPNQAEDATDAAEPPEAETDHDGPPIVRMNSAAIWLAPTWQGSEPRYVIAIMQETELNWSTSRALQDEIGATLAKAVADRIAGRAAPLSLPCLKQTLY